MKIFTAAQVHDWDEFTIQNEPVSSLELMERAAAACTENILSIYPQFSFSIICGKGNNGGDGLAIARMLIEKGKKASIYILEFGFPGTTDFQSNLSRLHNVTDDIHYIQDVSHFPAFLPGTAVIDCIYGSGLNRKPDGILQLLIRHINETAEAVIAIDIPTGIFADHSSVDNQKIRANHTLSFQTPKLAFMLAENEDYLGNIHLLNIGLHPGYVLNTEASFEVITPFLLRAFLKQRKRSAHEGDFGHALLIAGSNGKMGAAILAARSSMRSGAGLLTTMVPSEGNDIMQVSFPEAMTLTYTSTSEALNFDIANFTAVGIGPGIGTTTEKINLIEGILNKYKQPVLLDADALNCIGLKKELLTIIPPGSVLTPHPKEFDRLFGSHPDHHERLVTSIKKSTELNCVIVLKGHHSFIASPGGKGYFNNTGNPGMATAGSGDVLSGIITGLLAQGYSGTEAALLAVYLHGYAGDLASEQISMESLIAGDITDFLGKAFLALNKRQ